MAERKILKTKIFCHACAEEAFKIWKGWCSFGTNNWSERDLEKTKLPDIPELVDGKCPRCGGEKRLADRKISYQNIHGPGNTGLPDYFVLYINGTSPRKGIIYDKSSDKFNEKWGFPYRSSRIKLVSLDDLKQHVKKLYPHGD